MNRDFLPLVALEGELKISIKKSEQGITVSTKELVYHKPHTNYYIKLEDIISIVPYNAVETPRVRFGSGANGSTEYAGLIKSEYSYNVYVRGALMHNRSGLFTLGKMQFVLPVAPRALELIGKYSGLRNI